MYSYPQYNRLFVYEVKFVNVFKGELKATVYLYLLPPAIYFVYVDQFFLLVS